MSRACCDIIVTFWSHFNNWGSMTSLYWVSRAVFSSYMSLRSAYGLLCSMVTSRSLRFTQALLVTMVTLLSRHGQYNLFLSRAWRGCDVCHACRVSRALLQLSTSLYYYVICLHGFVLCLFSCVHFHWWRPSVESYDTLMYLIHHLSNNYSWLFL